eukprot:4083894-Prymnesium_polylepis.1
MQKRSAVRVGWDEDEPIAKRERGRRVGLHRQDAVLGVDVSGGNAGVRHALWEQPIGRERRLEAGVSHGAALRGHGNHLGEQMEARPQRLTFGQRRLLGPLLVILLVRLAVEDAAAGLELRDGPELRRAHIVAGASSRDDSDSNPRRLHGRAHRQEAARKGARLLPGGRITRLSVAVVSHEATKLDRRQSARKATQGHDRIRRVVRHAAPAHARVDVHER